jgi:hypothetical protein
MVADSALGRQHPIVRQASAPAERRPGFADRAEEADRLQDWRIRLVREWLLLLLRFAITRDPRDEVPALIMAREIDCLGRQLGGSAPTFFRRSSSEFCKAVIGADNPEREAILWRHLARIEDQRIKSALQAVIRSGGPMPASQRPVRPRFEQEPGWS